MSKFKKILVIALCLIIPTTILCGCKNNESDFVKQHSEDFSKYRQITVVDGSNNELLTAVGRFAILIQKRYGVEQHSIIIIVFHNQPTSYQEYAFEIDNNYNLYIKNVENTSEDYYCELIIKKPLKIVDGISR